MEREELKSKTEHCFSYNCFFESDLSGRIFKGCLRVLYTIVEWLARQDNCTAALKHYMVLNKLGQLNV